jgi:hypothetical protein
VADLNYRWGLSVPVAALGIWLAARWAVFDYRERGAKRTPGRFTPEDLLATFDGQDLSTFSEGELKLWQLAVDAIAAGVGKPRPVIAYAIPLALVGLAVAIFVDVEEHYWLYVAIPVLACIALVILVRLPDAIGRASGRLYKAARKGFDRAQGS